MREIKFRAKRADTGAWVYGDLTHTVKMNTKEQAEKTGKRTEPVIRVANYDVDENTVGQFTGIYDKDGNSIYEDDIILYEPATGLAAEYVVVFDEGAFCVHNSIDNSSIPLIFQMMNKYKIVGNAHDYE